MYPLELPLALLFEVVVTLGAAALAWGIAPGETGERQWWCLATVVVAFAWHRAVALAVGSIEPGPPWTALATVGASAIVFMAAPIVLPLLVRRTMMRKFPARWPPEDRN